MGVILSKACHLSFLLFGLFQRQWEGGGEGVAIRMNHCSLKAKRVYFCTDLKKILVGYCSLFIIYYKLYCFNVCAIDFEIKLLQVGTCRPTILQ